MAKRSVSKRTAIGIFRQKCALKSLKKYFDIRSMYVCAYLRKGNGKYFQKIDVVDGVE